LFYDKILLFRSFDFKHCSDKSTVAAQIINSIHICPVMNSRIGELLCICPILDSWYVNIQTYVLLLYICHVYYQHSQHGMLLNNIQLGFGRGKCTFLSTYNPMSIYLHGSIQYVMVDIKTGCNCFMIKSLASSSFDSCLEIRPIKV
jgi:hypothetical protein